MYKDGKKWLFYVKEKEYPKSNTPKQEATVNPYMGLKAPIKKGV
jgi:hypothetical protein